MTDGLFMAVLLRFFAAVLKTLTASYSSDTVHALAMASLFLHFLACDYSYANGFSDKKGPIDATKRPAFQGGTLSLTAAFFATILLASRLESNAAVYMFVCSSVVLFALYPAARHQVAINTQTKNRIGTCWLYFMGVKMVYNFSYTLLPIVPLLITGMLTAATFLLLEPPEMILVVVALATLCVFVPLWIGMLQSSKVTLRGPWDIAHV